MEIRAGSREDAPAIEAVHFASRDEVYRARIPDWSAYGPQRPARVERWEEWLTNPGTTSLVGEVDGEIVGFVTVRGCADEGEDPTVVAEMPTLYVHPSRWRRGYGRALCAAALDRARERGYTELTLWVVDLNVEAHGFYKAYGFVEDGATTVDEGASQEISVTARRYRISLAE